MYGARNCGVIAGVSAFTDAALHIPTSMTIQRRLAISFTVVLALSLAMGLGLTYGHVLSKVRTETQAALNVGADSVKNSLELPGRIDDPAGALRRVVSDFDGDRHLRAVLARADGSVLAQSRPLAPEEAAPPWFYRLVAAPAARLEIPLPQVLAGVGHLTLQTDAHNEVAEAWSDTRLTLTILAFFFAMVLLLAFATVKAALAPLRDIGQALNRVGSGDYTTRLAGPVAAELEPLRDGFNRMASRLEDMGLQNRALNEQILNLQEEERAELARDLHDDVAPFLFSVGADSAMIRQFLARGETDAVGPRAEAIAEAVRHMQHHLKDVLRRLAPGALLDLGLPGAIDNLVSFWRSRQPGVAFEIEVSGDPIDPPLDAVAFRVVQESFSNAMRHGAPKTIEVTIDADDVQAVIVVEDDGKGFPKCDADLRLRSYRHAGARAFRRRHLPGGQSLRRPRRPGRGAPACSPTPTPQFHADPGNARMKLLLVDDHAVVREGVRRLLSVSLDAPLLEAQTGREALTVFRAEKPEVVILDLNLPRLRRSGPAPSAADRGPEDQGADLLDAHDAALRRPRAAGRRQGLHLEERWRRGSWSRRSAR